MPHISATNANGVYVITLNRPTAGNALAPETFKEWQGHIAKASADDNVRAIVVTGAGKFFSTGADVKAIASHVMEDPSRMADVLRNGSAKTTTMLIDCPKLLVAALNGPVVGYPAGLVGVFDAVYVAPSATYSMPFLHLGIVPEGCSSHTLPATVGKALAHDILVTGRKLNAEEMVRYGLASRIVDGPNFIDQVVALVSKGVRSCARTSLLETTTLIRGPMRKTLHEANEQETRRVISQFESGVPVKRFAAVASSIGKKSKL